MFLLQEEVDQDDDTCMDNAGDGKRHQKNYIRSTPPLVGTKSKILQTNIFWQLPQRVMIKFKRYHHIMVLESDGTGIIINYHPIIIIVTETCGGGESDSGSEEDEREAAADLLEGKWRWWSDRVQMFDKILSSKIFHMLGLFGIC